MRVHAHIPIGEIAAELPHVTKLLDLLGVDYVMHGNLSLRDACAEAGVDPATVRGAIDALPREEADRPAWTDATTQELLDELLGHVHPKLLIQLQDASILIRELPAGTEGLDALRVELTKLARLLQNHIGEEEQTLYPAIQHLEDFWTRSERLPGICVRAVEELVAGFEAEHASILNQLRLVRCAADDLRDDDVMITRLLDHLGSFAHELREHIHIENNVLYPRAIALEAAVVV